MAQALANVITKALNMIDMVADVFVDIDATDPLTAQGVSLVQAIAGAATVLTSAIADVVSGQIVAY